MMVGERKDREVVVNIALQSTLGEGGSKEHTMHNAGQWLTMMSASPILIGVAGGLNAEEDAEERLFIFG